MINDDFSDSPAALRDAERWAALGAGMVLLIAGASRRTAFGAGLAVASGLMLYRGLAGHWPVNAPNPEAITSTLGLNREVDVRESFRIERPVADVWQVWRRLGNLPRVMTHLERVTETSERRSHWVAAGPAGLVVEWDAEIVSDVEHEELCWRSLPGSDIVTSGSVTLEPARGGRSTQVRVHLRYAPPAGKAGNLIASLFGRAPAQTVREDLRRLKQELEAGEIPRATATT